jgi:hypothetical protein
LNCPGFQYEEAGSPLTMRKKLLSRIQLNGERGGDHLGQLRPVQFREQQVLAHPIGYGSFHADLPKEAA